MCVCVCVCVCVCFHARVRAALILETLIKLGYKCIKLVYLKVLTYRTFSKLSSKNLLGYIADTDSTMRLCCHNLSTA